VQVDGPEAVRVADRGCLRFLDVLVVEARPAVYPPELAQLSQPTLTAKAAKPANKWQKGTASQPAGLRTRGRPRDGPKTLRRVLDRGCQATKARLLPGYAPGAPEVRQRPA